MNPSLSYFYWLQRVKHEIGNLRSDLNTLKLSHRKNPQKNPVKPLKLIAFPR